MSVTKELVTVDQVTQYGIRSAGVNYGLSPRLKEKGVEPSSFQKGATYEVDIYIGPKGGRSINSFNQIGTASVSNPALNAGVPPVPSLPPTTSHKTEAPLGDAPVKAARKEVSPDVWAAKDKSIETQAVLKSVLESPALAQLAVGKREEEVLQTGKRMFEFFLQVFKDAKNS